MCLAEKKCNVFTKYLILILFYASLSIANAQNDLLNNASYDEVIALYKKNRFKNSSKALTYALQAKDLALINGDDTQLTKALYYISKCHNRLAENKSALKNIELAISQATMLKDTLLLYKTFNLKGSVFSELGEDSKALTAYLKTIEYAKHTENTLNEIAPSFNIALIKKKHKDYDEAIILFKKILKRLNTLGDNDNTRYYSANTFISLADSYLRLKKPDEAAFYNEAGLKKSWIKKMPITYHNLLMNKAIIQYQNEHYNTSVLLAKEIGDYALKTENEPLYVTSLFYRGKSYYNLNEYEESIHYLEKAYNIMNASDNTDTNEKELHEFLSLAYSKKENLEKVLFHSQKYIALEKKESKEDLKINNETHQQNDIIPLHKKIDKLDEELTAEAKDKKELFTLFLIVLLLFLSCIVYYIIRARAVKRKFKELLKKVPELEHHKEKQGVDSKDQITDKQVKVILEKLSNFEKEEHYLLTECSLGYLAEKLETNTAYLSKVINKYKGKSYSIYIADLRINAAIIKLKNDEKLQSYTIKAVAEEFGFKRQETFSKAFKAHTGIYPSQYLRNLRKKS